MCWNVRSGKVEVVEAQADAHRRPQKGTTIHNETENTIVLRDANRYASRYDRLKLMPGEKKVLILKPPCTFFRMTAIKKVGSHEEQLNLSIYADQLGDGRQISVCCSSEGEFVLREPDNA